jgi:hypothetical protein
MIRVEVTAGDIAAGEGGDCFRCAAALALQRATGDDHANVYERDCVLYVEAWSRHLVAPYELKKFVWDFDDLPRCPDGTPDTADPEYLAPAPFGVELPDQSDPEWQEQCYGCEDLFDAAELDDEGRCASCAAEEDAD